MQNPKLNHHPAAFFAALKPSIEITTRLLAIVTLLFLTGCASGVKRTNYRFAENHDGNAPERCRIAIKYKAKYVPEDVEVLGAIKAFDTGVSLHCDEAYVLELFCREACMLGADLVNITEEKQPDKWSTCYRASAEFVRFNDRAKIKSLYSDISYSLPYIIERSERSKQRSKEMIRTAIISGALGGAMGGMAAGAAAGR